MRRIFYKILGVTKGVSDADLKKAYRKLAKNNHPDLHPGDQAAESRFKDISEAYDVLSDVTERKEYDAVRAMGGGARFQAVVRAEAKAAVLKMCFQTFSAVAVFPGGGFGGGGFAPQRGPDLTTSSSVDFIDSIHGTNIKLTVSGKPVTLKVPAGIQDGQKLKLKGKGQPSPNGGQAGDLVVSIKVRPHPVFTRDGDNVRVVVPVTFSEAVLGAVISVPVLGGEPVKLKVAPGTPNGRTLRVKGKGVQHESHQGDLLASVDILVPNRISKKAEEALRAFDKEIPVEDPRATLISRAGLL